MRLTQVLDKDTGLLAALGLTGAIIGLTQLLASGDKITFRLVLTRAILSGAIGMTATAFEIIAPALSMPAKVGIACLLASIGTSALERVLQRITGTKE